MAGRKHNQRKQSTDRSSDGQAGEKSKTNTKSGTTDEPDTASNSDGTSSGNVSQPPTGLDDGQAGPPPPPSNGSSGEKDLVETWLGLWKHPAVARDHLSDAPLIRPLIHTMNFYTNQALCVILGISFALPLIFAGMNIKGLEPRYFPLATVVVFAVFIISLLLISRCSRVFFTKIMCEIDIKSQPRRRDFLRRLSKSLWPSWKFFRIFFVAIILPSAITIIYISFFKLQYSIILVSVVLFVSACIAYLICMCIIASLIDSEQEKTLVNNFRAIAKLPVDKYPKAFVYWERNLLINPFGYRFVWWWSLIVGVMGAYISASYDPVKKIFKDISQTILSGEYGKNMMACIAVSVFAYIATNVIHELIVIRDKYDRAGKKLEDTTETIEKFNGTLKNTTSVAKQKFEGALGAANSALEVLGLCNQEKMFFKDTDHSKIKGQKEDLIKNMKEQMGNFMRQLGTAGSVDEHTQICMAATLNQYIKTEVGGLNGKQKKLLTTYTGLGEISSNLVSSIVGYGENKSGKSRNSSDKEKHEVVFNGNLLVTPFEFLGIYREDGRSAEEKNLWKKFLNGNYNNSLKHVRQNRCFWTKQNDDGAKIREQLKAGIIFEAFKVKSENRDGFEECTETKTRLCPYYSEQVDEPVAKGSTECSEHPNCEYKSKCHTARHIISELYHYGKVYFCENLESLKKMEEFFKSKGAESGTYNDYFAVKIDGSWTFCMETIYNKNLDYAKISLYHDDICDTEYLNEWKKIKDEKLNNIFP